MPVVGIAVHVSITTSEEGPFECDQPQVSRLLVSSAHNQYSCLSHAVMNQTTVVFVVHWIINYIIYYVVMYYIG